MRSIELGLTARPLERIVSEIAVAGFFADDRPLRGGAARADWRLCGGLSQRIGQGDVTGKSGEAMLVGCERALRSPRLLLVGLGDRRAFDRCRLTEETRDALLRCRRLALRRVALAPLGIAPDDLPRHAPSLLAGIVEAFEDCDEPVSLDLCVQRSEIPLVFRAFEAAFKAARSVPLTLVARED